MEHTFVICGMLGTGEIIVIAIIVLLLFGGRKIPELMRGLGKGVREFKDATNGKTTDTDSKTDDISENKNESNKDQQ